MDRLPKYIEPIVVKDHMTPHMLGVRRNIVSSEQVSNVFDLAMKHLLKEHKQILGSTTWKDSTSSKRKASIKLEMAAYETKFHDMLIASTEDGSEVFVYDLNFSVDLACGIEIHNI